MITTYEILHNLIKKPMDEAVLSLCNIVKRGTSLWLILPVARTQFISNLYMFRIVCYLLKLLQVHRCFYLRKDLKNLA